MKFGAHMSAAGGAWRALQRGRSVNCDVIQIFVKNNMQWFGKPVQPRNLALYAHELAANTFSCVFGHTGYLINLGAPASENRRAMARPMPRAPPVMTAPRPSRETNCAIERPLRSGAGMPDPYRARVTNPWWRPSDTSAVWRLRG